MGTVVALKISSKAAGKEGTVEKGLPGNSLSGKGKELWVKIIIYLKGD